MLSIEGRGVLNPFVRVVDGTVPSNELSQALVEIERRTNTESSPSYVNGRLLSASVQQFTRHWRELVMLYVELRNAAQSKF